MAIDPEVFYRVKELIKEQLHFRAIAVIVGISRNTVSEIARQAAPIAPQAPTPPAKLVPGVKYPEAPEGEGWQPGMPTEKDIADACTRFKEQKIYEYRNSNTPPSPTTGAREERPIDTTVIRTQRRGR